MDDDAKSSRKEGPGQMPSSSPDMASKQTRWIAIVAGGVFGLVGIWVFASGASLPFAVVMWLLGLVLIVVGIFGRRTPVDEALRISEEFLPPLG